MRYLDLTLPSLAENLALDEALLDEAERATEPLETLRIWEAATPGVVIGRSSRVAAEVRGDVCRELKIPVLRRISGGAAVVVGPGCLMYALVLSLRLRPQLRNLDQAHAQVLGAIVAALRAALVVPPSGGIGNDTASQASFRLKPTQQAPELAERGTCDLAIGDKKVSGNAVRCKRDYLLYHGTLLYDFPLALVGRVLAMPPRHPEYRHRAAARYVRDELAVECGRALRRATLGVGRVGILRGLAAGRHRSTRGGKVLPAGVERTVVGAIERR